MKKFWIIGSSSGIGKELAKKLDAKGYNLILSSRNEEKLKQLNNELINDHEIIPLDLSDKDQCLRISRDIINKEIDSGEVEIVIENFCIKSILSQVSFLSYIFFLLIILFVPKLYLKINLIHCE